MDDEGAKKLIAVIHRLANRIDSLDKITVEAAAISHEGRRAAMDAADATSPKQTADHLAAQVKPVLTKFDNEFRKKMDTLDQNIRSFFSETQINTDRMKAAARDAAATAKEHRERSRNLRIVIGGTGFSLIVVMLISAWIFREPLLISKWGCAALGGSQNESALGNYCMINAW